MKNRSHSKEKKHNDYDRSNSELIKKIKYNIRLNRLETALAFIEEYLTYNPFNNYILGYKAMVLYKLGLIDESISLFEDLLDKSDISDRDRLFTMSQYASMLSSDNKELAIYYFEKVINESNNLELVARSKLSILYSDLKRYDEAINILTIEGFNNMFLNSKKATIYYLKGDFKGALKCLEEKEYNTNKYDIREKLDEDYVNQDINYIKGHIYYKQTKLNKALTYLTKATTLKNRTVSLKANLDIVKILMLNGKIDEAINLCEESKKQCTSNYYHRMIDELLAKAYTKKNDYKKAENYYTNIDTDEKNRNINLGKLELLKGNFEKAEKHFSYLDINVDDINVFYEEFYKLMLVKLRLQKYDEVEEILDLFRQNHQKHEISCMKYELDRIKLYIKTLKNEPINYDQLTYSEKQIVSYDENNALKHVIDHHIDNYKTSRFNENISVEVLFNDIKDKLTKDNVVYDSLYDKYIIKYRNIGYNKNGDTIHQLMILTLPNTKNIITMYPCEGTESVFTLEELEEKPKPKVKRLSQIEKFNKKYGNN